MVGSDTVLIEYNGCYHNRPSWSQEVLNEIGLTCDLLFSYAVYGAQSAMDCNRVNIGQDRLLSILSDIMYNDLDDQVGTMSMLDLERLDELIVLTTQMAYELLPAMAQVQRNIGRDVSFEYVEFNHDTLMLHMEY